MLLRQRGREASPDYLTLGVREMVKRSRPGVRKQLEQQRRSAYQPEPIPWHFKLLGLLLVPYLLFRFYQLLHWLLERF